jgi:hypothetical protein
MRSVSLVLVSVALMVGTAHAAPPVRLMMAEQVADAPTDQDTQTGNSATTPNESPSKKLSQTKGVIHPPPTGDHSVVKPPKDTTGAAVIAPPGTPGGDQSVQPK